jgi:hypothetical protein
VSNFYVFDYHVTAFISDSDQKTLNEGMIAKNELQKMGEIMAMG